jgi:hypothetical protein
VSSVDDLHFLPYIRKSELSLYYFSKADYSKVAKHYGASKMDFAALILQEEIEVELRPYQLAAKSKLARVRQPAERMRM